jgi:Uma2 family endonuclease
MAANLEMIPGTDYFWPPTRLDFHGARLTDEQFEVLCRNNPDSKFELSAEGELIMVPPTSLESSWRNFDLVAEFAEWVRTDGTGLAFDSNALFTLPNGAKRSPDVSWMPREKYETLSPAERRKFARIVPDFVIELLSPSDDLAETQAKMAEYIENGVRLGWLIDPDKRTVYVYRANGEVETIKNAKRLAGEDVLNGLDLDITRIW